MSRESRLAKRDGKLKKLAAKRGKLVPQSVKEAERFHAQRFAYVTRKLAEKRELAELQARNALPPMDGSQPAAEGVVRVDGKAINQKEHEG